MNHELYRFTWGDCRQRPSQSYLPGRKGTLCRVLLRGGRNSALVEFVAEGVRHVISRNAIKKAAL
jgi:hypothetical protein